MYILIDRNSKGNLEIEEKILSKIIEFDVRENSTGYSEISASVSIYQETNLFIVVTIKAEEKGKFFMDGKKVVKIINKSISDTLKLRPKNIAFAFLK